MDAVNQVQATYTTEITIGAFKMKVPEELLDSPQGMIAFMTQERLVECEKRILALEAKLAART